MHGRDEDDSASITGQTVQPRADQSLHCCRNIGLGVMQGQLWFEGSPTFLDTRRARLESVIFALEAINRGQSLSRKVVSLRYTELLPTVGAPQRQALLGELRRHSLLPATGT